MGHLPTLITDLALILITGATVTLLFKWIKQPIVLGYIIAGFCVGPHLSLIPTVAGTENVKTLAEIGVIFLLFSLGLEFNFKKLMHVGGASSITALVEIIFITLAGYIVGRLLGWSAIDSIFLGGMLASSSTTIIIKAFDDLGIKTKKYAGVVFGVLIVEDIVVILLLVLLPTISAAQQFSGLELILTILKLLFFLILIFISGIFLLPTFFRKSKKFLNDETLLILTVGLCLGMVVLANYAGFSAELGAFMIGVILAESTSAEKIEQTIKPVKDLFAAVFFVSIGMMIEPSMIIKYGWAVAAVTGLTIFGKLISTTAGALISGQPMKQSIQIGMSMAQIGEFAFIVATLGLSLGVISDFLFPVAVAASAITTFTTPYMIKYSDKLYGLINKLLPENWITAIQNYSASTQSLRTERSWKKVIKSYAAIVLINSTIGIAIVLLSKEFLLPVINSFFQNNVISGLIGLIISLILIVPFLWGIMVKQPDGISYKELWVNNKYNHGPLLVVEILRIIAGLLIIGFLVDKFFSALVALSILVPLVFIAVFVFSKQIKKFYDRLEERFLANLSTDQKKSPHAIEMQEPMMRDLNLSPWDAHLVELDVEPNAEYIGKTLVKLAWREKYGINIAFIKRGDDSIFIPTKEDRLFPKDRIGIIVTDEQMMAFKPAFEASDKASYNKYISDEIVIQSILINNHNKLRGQSIRDSGIREKTNGLVIGIERNNERILNPISSTIFEWGDIVWLVGVRKKIQNLNTGL